MVSLESLCSQNPGMQGFCERLKQGSEKIAVNITDEQITQLWIYVV